MTRENALIVLKENLHNQNLLKHSLAVEAIMRALARHFGQNQEEWGLAGLLHDIDYEKVKEDPSQHSLLGAKMLEEIGLDEDMCLAVKTHNEAHGISPERLLGKALFVADPLTGLIVAATLVLPSRKIKDLTAENVLKRFKEKAFARGADREIIKQCQGLLGLELEAFVKIGLGAMQGASQELGL